MAGRGVRVSWLATFEMVIGVHGVAMDARRIAAKLLTSPASFVLLDAAAGMICNDAIRRPLLRAADRRLSQPPEKNQRISPAWRRITRERMLLARAILHTVDRLLQRRALSPAVMRVVLELWGRALCIPDDQQPARRRFQEEYGCEPPWFIVVGPGQACNLSCPNCYADASSSAAKLPWSTLDRLIGEARALWGVALVVFSGGEPLAYRSEGRDLLDAAEQHPDCLFLMFTNGTLIDRPVAERLARLGNLTTAISVEGLRQRTDQHRGAGVFDRVLEAMGNLRAAGVPFGISLTASRANSAEVLSDELVDLFFEVQGAFYAFLFQYMPIGRGAVLDAMPTPEQRIELWRRSWEVIERKRVFLFDFWNHGPLVRGCVSAGRERGYVYVDWSGRVMPCVFAPYSVASIQEVFAAGQTLNDLWQAPFFQAIREWQRGYGFGRPEPSREGNWLRPCPIRDHYALFRQWVDRHRPEPEDESARQALQDDAYGQGLASYGTEVGRRSQGIWEKCYLGMAGPEGGGPGLERVDLDG